MKMTDFEKAIKMAEEDDTILTDYSVSEETTERGLVQEIAYCTDSGWSYAERFLDGKYIAYHDLLPDGSYDSFGWRK